MLDPKRVQTHVRFCAETLQTAVAIHEAAKREEDRNVAKREEQRQRLKVRLPAPSCYRVRSEFPQYQTHQCLYV